MPQQPAQADFVDYPILHHIQNLQPDREAIEVTWSDGHLSRYHHLWLRDNCPCSDCVNPATREQIFEIVSVPETLAPADCRIAASGALEIVWSEDGHRSHYHPGWLRAHCYCELEAAAGTALPTLWGAELNDRVPSFAHAAVIADDAALYGWLVALRDIGLTLLTGVPTAAEAVEAVVRRIAFAKETNFGRYWNVRAELENNSNAYTAFELPLHGDLPTREYMPGLQFLHCLVNQAAGGDSLFVDGFQIGETLRAEAPEAFQVLSRQAVEFRNTDKAFDYRFTTPMIRLGDDGRIVEVRVGNFLRGPYRTRPEAMMDLYRAYRRLVLMTRQPRFQVRRRFVPGDLIAFDNRRVLHAHTAFDAVSGKRHLRGCYLDRDELLSRIRILKRGQAPAG